MKPGDREERLVLPSNMALRAVVILATIGFVYSQSHCSAFGDGTNDGRDCSCADRSFGGCVEPSTGAKLDVVNLEECQALCSAWSSCEWFIFDKRGGPDLNCRMFGPDRGSIADYLSSCSLVGRPLRNEADICLAEPSDMFCGSQNDYCPGGCASCAGDRCNDFAETECVLTSIETSTANSVPDASLCQTLMTSRSFNEICNYFTYDQYAQLCKGFPDGRRACPKIVAAKNIDIQSCQT